MLGSGHTLNKSGIHEGHQQERLRQRTSAGLRASSRRSTGEKWVLRRVRLSEVV